MKRHGVRLTALAAAAATALMVFAGSAGASIGGTYYSPEQAGFGATGTSFRYVQTTVKLPDAASFSPEVAGFGLSVQIWSGNRVMVLGISDSTASSPYSAAVAVYNRTTHALICSTAGSGSLKCGNAPAGWSNGSVSFPAGDQVTPSIYYDRRGGTVRFSVTDATSKQSLTFTRSMFKTYFTQVRVGAEFSAISPWREGFTYNPPANVVHLATLTGCVVTTSRGRRTSFYGAWPRHKIVMTTTGGSSGTVNAIPSDLSNHGRNFTVSLMP